MPLLLATHARVARCIQNPYRLFLYGFDVDYDFWLLPARELALHDALVAFDRQAGYPFAWFFHMLTTKAVPHWVARVVTEDALAGFAYLPRRDETVVRNWLHRPYAF